MGMGEYRGLITVVTFLAVTLIIVSAGVSATPSFFTGTPTGITPKVPSGVNPTEYLAWNVTNAIQLNSSSSPIDYTIPNWHITTWYDWSSSGHPYILVESFDWWGPFRINRETMLWYNETTGAHLSVPISASGFYNPEGMPLSDLTTWYTIDNSTVHLAFKLTNGKGSLHIALDWNTTAYSTAEAAMSGQGIFFSLKQDFGDRQTSINILDVIAGLFLGSIFNSNTLGIDPTMSAIITVALDSALAYILFTIVRSLIPFLPGGD